MIGIDDVVYIDIEGGVVPNWTCTFVGTGSEACEGGDRDAFWEEGKQRPPDGRQPWDRPPDTALVEVDEQSERQRLPQQV